MSAAAASATTTIARFRVFSGYRRLFRARKLLFTGDDVAMKESRIAIKHEFIKNRHVDVIHNNEHFNGLIAMIDEATDMLTNGIVRGNLNQTTGHYEVKLRKEHAESSTLPMVEPITAEAVAKLEKPMVETTKCSSSSSTTTNTTTS